MRILILGGVAAGTKIAAKLMREDRGNEVIVLNKGKHISYAGCGLPYYVGHVIEEKEQLIVNTPEKYEKLTGATVLTEMEAVRVHPQEKKVEAVNVKTQEAQTFAYDRLVISVGADPVKPPVAGCDLKNVYFVRTPEDAISIRAAADLEAVKRAVVVGAGYIGLEIAENLKLLGIETHVLDMAPQALPGFDPEMAAYAREKLLESGISVVTGVAVTGIEGDGRVERVVTDAQSYPADLVVLSAGIRPNTAFLDGIGLEMVKGTILTNAKGETNLPDIYAAGDCAMVRHAVTGQPAWSPMGSTANINGRLIAGNIMGADLAYRGVLGTAVCKLPGLNAARTGLTEAQAAAEGFDPVSVVAVVDDKAHYYPGASAFIIKMIADQKSLRLLGVQAFGAGAVDKIIDIAVTGIMLTGTLLELADMDLAYAPPFSTAIHPFAQTLNILMNKITGRFETVTPAEYAKGAAEGYRVVDVCMAPSIPGALRLELTDVNGPVDGLDPEENILIVCNRGKRAYLLQNRLKHYGYTHTKALEGGITFNHVTT